MKRLFAVLLILVALAWAGDIRSLIPGTTTTATTASVRLKEIVLTNTSDSDVTVTITDRGSPAYELLSQCSIAARTTYIMGFNGTLLSNGFTWSASTGNVVVARVWTY